MKPTSTKIASGMRWDASHLRPDATSQLAGKQEAAKKLLAILGVGAVGGFGARALQEFGGMAKEEDTPVMPNAMIPQPFSFNALPKTAGVIGDVVNSAKSYIPSMDQVADKIAPHLPASTTTNPLANDWGIPATVAAAGGASYGGYKLLDWLLQANKQRSQAGQLEDAEKDYENALSEQYRAAMQTKRASDDLGIDELYEKRASLSVMEKLLPGQGLGLGAIYDNTIGHDAHQFTKGVQNAALMLLAAGAGKATYDHTRARNQDNLVGEALKQRQRQRQKLSPPPLLALPRREPEPEPTAAGY
jgi:hypothetical protein